MDNILFEFIGDHADNVDVYEETYARPQAEVEPTDTGTTTVDLELGTKFDILESNEPKSPGKNPADSPLISFLPEISDHQLIESPMDTEDTQMDLNELQCQSKNLSLPSLENKEEISSAQEFQPMEITTQPTDVSVSETADCEAASIPNNDQQPVVKGKKEEKKRKKAKEQIVSSKTPLPSITFLSPTIITNNNLANNTNNIFITSEGHNTKNTNTDITIALYYISIPHEGYNTNTNNTKNTNTNIIIAFNYIFIAKIILVTIHYIFITDEGLNAFTNKN
nr:putative uncharacterized protein DDB_G0285119 [Drosophila kikkawai]